ncbi:relaxase/mobilization nuclease domain-containing protein [Sphingobacterium siyangense]|uniref:relaxase/mobilization nuclease domain-containing protein n=1 Tax=Sphingobacterium siyangense TaxID=459529 RepID=UPI003DA68C6A
MVARIKCSTNIRKPYHYNDNKVREGDACLLAAENMLVQVDTHRDKAVLLLEKQVALRPDVKVNSVHISLNFSPDEQLTNEQMAQIARDYIEGIGFGNQPYLIYRHFDSGHPHCHIVTTNICLNKSRISLHQIGKLKSEPVRKELENKYGLIKAEGQNTKTSTINPFDASKVLYGKVATKQALSKVLNAVIPVYKYGSLAELNAVLGIYNVKAEQGNSGSRIEQNRGLVYRVLDHNGQCKGVPIKASLFSGKPTLLNLEKRFLANDVARSKYKDSLKSKIDIILKFKKCSSLRELQYHLKSQDIRLVPRVNENGIIYGLTYIDLKSKAVFNGSSLGKEYSAKAILERIHLTKIVNPDTGFEKTFPLGKGYPNELSKENNSNVGYERLDEKSALTLLMQYEYAATNVPYEWKKKKKRRKK